MQRCERKSKVRVVLDSNLWISALQFKGTPLAALELASCRDRIVFSAGIESEVSAALLRKFAWRNHRLQQVLELYLSDVVRVQTTGTVQGICRDPKDDMILECAQLANADLLVSGDRDLLSLGTFGPTRILTARAYLDLRSEPV